jgi:hypothetical protein
VARLFAALVLCGAALIGCTTSEEPIAVNGDGAANKGAAAGAAGDGQAGAAGPGLAGASGSAGSQASGAAAAGAAGRAGASGSSGSAAGHPGSGGSSSSGSAGSQGFAGSQAPGTAGRVGTAGSGTAGSSGVAGAGTASDGGAPDAPAQEWFYSGVGGIENVLINNCGGCHFMASGVTVQGGFYFSYANVTGVVTSGNKACQSLDASKRRVVPGKPENSLLYIKASLDNPPAGCGGHMPYKGTRIGDSILGIIRDWILQGAKP